MVYTHSYTGYLENQVKEAPCPRALALWGRFKLNMVTLNVLTQFLFSYRANTFPSNHSITSPVFPLSVHLFAFLHSFTPPWFGLCSRLVAFSTSTTSHFLLFLLLFTDFVSRGFTPSYRSLIQAEETHPNKPQEEKWRKDPSP